MVYKKKYSRIDNWHNGNLTLLSETLYNSLPPLRNCSTYCLTKCLSSFIKWKASTQISYILFYIFDFTCFGRQWWKLREKVTLKNIVKLCRWHKTPATMGLIDESRGVKNLVTRPLYRQFPQTFTTVFCKKKSLVKCKLCAANSILTTIHDSIMMIQ